MATIINNPTPSPSQPTVVETDSSGWVVTVVILLLVIAGGALWYFYHRGGTVPQAQDEATVNVTLPVPQDNSAASQ